LAFPAINRRRFIQQAAAAGVAAIAADATLIEPNRPRLVRKEIRLRRWPSRLNGFTIALLSDFHYDPYFSVHPIRSAVEIVSRLRPDLVALTGDFVSASGLGSVVRGAADAEPCAELLAKLQAPHGVWAVLGNHDAAAGADQVTEALNAFSIPTLSNESVAIERDRARFWLGGVDDVLDGSPDLPVTLQGIPSEEAVVLMAHEPDYADYVARYPVDLQLSGHTHGGQVRIPFLPPLYLPPLAEKYISGLFQIRALTLYTTPGIGTVDLPVRWNCPAEVTFITLTRSSN
jgi:predicted MPP superfamily phosphohydrolase